MAATVATGPDTAQTRGKAAGFVPGFDGLRAIAALLVVLVHVGVASGFTFRSSTGDFLARGEIGVSVFFLISGFLLYRPFVAAALAGRPGPGIRSYLMRRALRIIPLYWVALTAYYLINGWSSVGGVTGLVGHVFFLQVYWRGWVLNGIGQAWSLCIEVTFYLALPLWAAGMRALDRRHRRSGRPHDPAAILRRELLALAAVYVASVLFRWWVVASPNVVTETAHGWLPAWGDHFALGMGLAAVASYVAQTGVVPKAVRWLSRPGADLACWAGAALVFWIASRHAGISKEPLVFGGVRTALARQLLYGLFAFLMLLPAVFGPARTGPIRRLLASRVLSLVGLVSYGVYLWHQMVVEELQAAHTTWKVLDTPFLPLLATAVVVTLAVSTVSYLFVERPGIAVGHRWMLRQRERAAVHTDH